MWSVANEGYRKNYNLFIIKIRKNNLKNGDEDVKQRSFTKIKSIVHNRNSDISNALFMKGFCRVTRNEYCFKLPKRPF